MLCVIDSKMFWIIRTHRYFLCREEKKNKTVPFKLTESYSHLGCLSISSLEEFLYLLTYPLCVHKKESVVEINGSRHFSGNDSFITTVTLPTAIGRFIDPISGDKMWKMYFL